MWLIGVLLLTLVVSACSPSTIQQSLRPEQATNSRPNSQQRKKQGLVVTDNPYTISSDRLEQMNKGGFGAY
jgi:hypothetical protein